MAIDCAAIALGLFIIAWYDKKRKENYERLGPILYCHCVEHLKTHHEKMISDSKLDYVCHEFLTVSTIKVTINTSGLFHDFDINVIVKANDLQESDFYVKEILQVA